MKEKERRKSQVEEKERRRSQVNAPKSEDLHKATGPDGGHHRRRQDSLHKPDPHHKGSATTSSHPVRPRAGTLKHTDTAHSIVSGHSKGHHDKRSIATSDDQAPNMVKLENTYKILPDATFLSSPVKTIIQDVIKSEFTSKTYDSVNMSKLCVLASDMIKEKVKKQIELPRFKIVCSVLVSERPEVATSLMVSSRCLWDHRYDNHVTVTVQKGSYVVVATVYALYAE